MNRQLIALLTTAALGVALGVLGLVAVYQTLQHGVPDQNIVMAIITVLALLQATVHLDNTVDKVQNGNGGS